MFTRRGFGSLPEVSESVYITIDALVMPLPGQRRRAVVLWYATVEAERRVTESPEPSRYREDMRDDDFIVRRGVRLWSSMRTTSRPARGVKKANRQNVSLERAEETFQITTR